MAEQRLIEQLDEALQAIIGRRESAVSGVDPEIAELLRIAADLRDLPRENFKARLRAELFKPISTIQRRGSMTTTAKQAQEGFHTLTPYLIVDDGAAAIEFYKKAFGATELMRMAEPGGRIGHAEIKIGDARIMLADEYPEFGILGPKAIGGSPVAMHVYVADVDALATRAVAAGAALLTPVEDQFYGDRSGKLADPFGHVWQIATRKEDLSAEAMQKRFDDIMQKEKETAEEGPERSKYSAAGPVKPIPRGFHSVTPYLHVQGAARFIDFLTQAFEAKEIGERTTGSDGAVLHAEVRIGDSLIETSDARGEHKPMPTAIHLYVNDADAVYKRALQAGATSMREPVDQPYGDREASLMDPFGNHWYVATHTRDVTHEEFTKLSDEHVKEPVQQPPGGKASQPVNPMREGFHTVTPYLTVREAAQLIDFAKAAFGATELYRGTGSAGGIHAELKIGDSIVMIGGYAGLSDDDVKTAAIYLYVPDVDAVYQRAVEAGGASILEPTDQPYGDRSAYVKDPFGNVWYIATHTKDVTS
jgi:PhnB protein